MRDKGTGSIYQRASDGKWVGTLEAGWTERGTRRRITVTRKTKKACAQALRDKAREIARKGIPAEGTDTGMTVKAFAGEWLKLRRERMSGSSYSTDETAVNKWIIPAIGHMRLNAIGARHVRSVDAAMVRAGLLGSARLRYDATLRTLLKAASAEGYAIPPGAFNAQRPVLNKSKRSDIPLEDAMRILHAAMGVENVSRWYFAFLEAARPAEALGLRWSMIDFERGTVNISWQLKSLRLKRKYDQSSGYHVPEGHEATQLYNGYHLTRPKTDAGERVLPIVEPVLSMLWEWKQVAPVNEWGLVWPRENGLPQVDKADRAQWKVLCKTAGVDSYDLYEARHTTATLLRAMNVPDEIIEAIMGHASILSTRAYIHTNMAQMRSALEGLSSHFSIEA